MNKHLQHANRKEIARLYKRTSVEGACRVWLGCRKPTGYGLARHRGKLWRVHRLVWTLIKGEIKGGKHVLHKYDVPACVQITHLFLGTHQENMTDRNRKGRYGHSGLRGSAIGNSRLWELEVHRIKQELAKGTSMKRLAQLYLVGYDTIRAIRN